VTLVCPRCECPATPDHECVTHVAPMSNRWAEFLAGAMDEQHAKNERAKDRP